MWSCAVVLADVLEGDGVLPDGELDLVGEVLAGKLRFPALRIHLIPGVIPVVEVLELEGHLLTARPEVAHDTPQ